MTDGSWAGGEMRQKLLAHRPAARPSETLIEQIAPLSWTLDLAASARNKVDNRIASDLRSDDLPLPSADRRPSYSQ
jgi:hypothetical protein